MKVIDTHFQGLKLIEPTVFADNRGFFMETYSETRFHECGITYAFIQHNQSVSVETSVLRGLHYQINPHAQTKLVRCTSGAIYDVVLDIRKGSPTYGKWQGFILSMYNKRQLLIPRGFAHGFCTLVPNCEVQYMVDAMYSPEHDRGIAWNDPSLGIDWPTSAPILSEKDANHPNLADADHNFFYEG